MGGLKEAGGALGPRLAACGGDAVTNGTDFPMAEPAALWLCPRLCPGWAGCRHLGAPLCLGTPPKIKKKIYEEKAGGGAGLIPSSWGNAWALAPGLRPRRGALPVSPPSHPPLLFSGTGCLERPHPASPGLVLGLGWAAQDLILLPAPSAVPQAGERRLLHGAHGRLVTPFGSVAAVGTIRAGEGRGRFSSFFFFKDNILTTAPYSSPATREAACTTIVGERELGCLSGTTGTLGTR